MRKLDLKKDKKGQGLSISMLVVIVLALLVLVVLAFGFGMGWKNMWGSLTSYFGGANIDSVASACSSACMSNSDYEFCSRERTVKAEENVFTVDGDDELMNREGDDLNASEVKASCHDLVSKEYTNLGFEKCDQLSCE